MAPTLDTPRNRDDGEPADDRSDVDEDDTHLEDSMDIDHAEDKADRLMNGKTYIESEEPTNYSLFQNPPGLGPARQRLFDVEEQIEMSLNDFEDYFSFVDNVWRKSKSGDFVKDIDQVTDVYWCRLRKSSSAKPYTPKPTPEGKTSRKKRVRDEKTCPMAIKVVRREGVRLCTIQRAVGPEVKHTHDLEYMDAIKRNSGIMDVARREAVKAFLPGSVFWKMREEPEKLEAAGGKHMKISDVRNVQYAWRQDNQQVALKGHAGYSQASKGPRRRDSSHTSQRSGQHAVQHGVHEAQMKHPQLQATSAVRASASHTKATAIASTQAYLPASHTHPYQHSPSHSTNPAHDLQAAATEDPNREALQYPDRAREFLEPYLMHPSPGQGRPHVTLTWATSLDARISLMPNVQTAISGPETKAMTHYLRSRHDAIIIGVRTAIADDPSLNCRLAGAGGYGGLAEQYQPRPIIIDPHARLRIRPDMKVLRVVSEGKAKAPWIVVSPNTQLQPAAIQTLRSFGGEYLMIHDIDPATGHFNWESVFGILFKEGIKSIMIEGGGHVLSELLKTRYTGWIDSVILTIAPTFLGRNGVEVSPGVSMDPRTHQPIPTRLRDIRWQPMGDADVVMCGHMHYENPYTNGLLPGIQEFTQQSEQSKQQQQQQHSQPLLPSLAPTQKEYRQDHSHTKHNGAPAAGIPPPPPPRS